MQSIATFFVATPIYYAVKSKSNEEPREIQYLANLRASYWRV